VKLVGNAFCFILVYSYSYSYLQYAGGMQNVACIEMEHIFMQQNMNCVGSWFWC